MAMRAQAYGHKVSSFSVQSYKMDQAIRSFSGTKPNTYTSGPSAGSNAEKFYGAVNIPGGKVLHIPYSKGNVGISDPVAGTYTEADAVPVGSARFRGGCYHADTGLVVMAPLLSPSIGLYDVLRKEFRLGPVLGSGTIGYFGAVVSSITNKVILVPGTKTTIGIYDPVTNEFTEGPAHGGTGAHISAVLKSCQTERSCLSRSVRKRSSSTTL